MVGFPFSDLVWRVQQLPTPTPTLLPAECHVALRLQIQLPFKEPYEIAPEIPEMLPHTNEAFRYWYHKLCAVNKFCTSWMFLLHPIPQNYLSLESLPSPVDLLPCSWPRYVFFSVGLLNPQSILSAPIVLMDPYRPLIPEGREGLIYPYIQLKNLKNLKNFKR